MKTILNQFHIFTPSQVVLIVNIIVDGNLRLIANTTVISAKKKRQHPRRSTKLFLSFGNLLLISQAEAIIADTQKSAGTKLAFLFAFPKITWTKPRATLVVIPEGPSMQQQLNIYNLLKLFTIGEKLVERLCYRTKKNSFTYKDYQSIQLQALYMLIILLNESGNKFK